MPHHIGKTEGGECDEEGYPPEERKAAGRVAHSILPLFLGQVFSY